MFGPSGYPLTSRLLPARAWLVRWFGSLLWLLLTSVPQLLLGYSLIPPPQVLAQISPGKNIRFPLIAATSTTTGLLPRAFGMLCCLDLLA